MEEIREYECPYFHITIDEDECYDRFMIATGLFKDDNIIKDEDRKSLYAMCMKCKKHGCN